MSRPHFKSISIRIGLKYCTFECLLVSLLYLIFVVPDFNTWFVLLSFDLISSWSFHCIEHGTDGQTKEALPAESTRRPHYLAGAGSELNPTKWKPAKLKLKHNWTEARSEARTEAIQTMTNRWSKTNTNTNVVCYVKLQLIRIPSRKSSNTWMKC